MPLNSDSPPALIRRLRPSEAALVNHLALAFLWNVELPGRSLAEVGAFLAQVPGADRSLAGDGAYFVAQIAGIVAAGGGWSVMPLDGGSPAAGQPVLSPLFFVDPEARRGLGARLLASIEKDIARAGHARAHALVPLGSTPVYEAVGYRRVAAEELAHGRVPAVRLTKALAAELAAVA